MLNSILYMLSLLEYGAFRKPTRRSIILCYMLHNYKLNQVLK